MLLLQACQPSVAVAVWKVLVIINLAHATAMEGGQDYVVMPVGYSTPLLCWLTQTAVCSPPCLNGGVCSSPGVCTCPAQQWEGDACQFRLFIDIAVFLTIQPSARIPASEERASVLTHVSATRVGKEVFAQQV
jgi:hypothetical protein